MKEKICWANTDDFEESDMVLVGVPDESRSHAIRKGTSEAPDKIREISYRDEFVRDGKKSLGLPFAGIGNCKLFDYGNIERAQIDSVMTSITTKSKIPLLIGGDHSITTDSIKSISKKFGPISLVYIDAHPDFIGTTRNYYGSILFDVLDCIDIKSSVQVGIRTPEQEELDNIKQYGLKVISPFEIAENGIKKVVKDILDVVGKNVYISFDMDSVDPAFAPGVSVPVPMGLTTVETIHLIKSIVDSGIIGMDILEVCPSFDSKDRTSHLASRMIGEIISSWKPTN